MQSSCCRGNEQEESENQKWRTRVAITLFLICIVVGTLLTTIFYRANAKRPRVQPLFRSGLPTNNRRISPYEDANIQNTSKITAFAEHPLCLETGRKIISEGGSVVDSAIAMLFCQGVVEPHHSGLGGGFLMMIYLRDTNQVFTLDARGTAPEGASATMFERRRNVSPKDIKGLHKERQGWLTVTIPGEGMGLWEAHKRHGKLPWQRLVDPAIRLASFGFPVSKNLASYCTLYKDTIYDNPQLRKVYINPATNETYEEEEDIINEDLAKVLMRIATNGVDYIYKGDGAIKIGDESIEKGGIISRRDFIDYKVIWSRALLHTFRNRDGRLFTLHLPPPPSCAIMIAMIINIVHEYQNSEERDITSPIHSPSFYHKVVEAMKHTFARKGYFGDVSRIPKKDIFRLLNLQWGASIRDLISSTNTFLPGFYMNNVSTYSAQTEDQGTTNVGVVAPNGDAVVASSSLNDPFGAGIISESLGFLMNNNMLSFTATKGGLPLESDYGNMVTSGKRPLSSMSPIIVLDDKDNFKLLMAASGGVRIPTTIALCLMRYFWLQDDISHALNKQYFHHQLNPNVVLYEGPPREYDMEYLRTFGHEVNMTDENWPHVKCIVQENETLISMGNNHEDF